jgi:hypothetical protein
MNNPDEKTAIEQFGNGDKYFGVATVMTTMPGLPMLGHGQIEGFREKYGMEYRRAYWDERPDEGLINHHEHVIFPLMRRRYLFAEMEHFLLYDLFSPNGTVNEDVFAYSNGHANERALIIYHNKYAKTSGWIKTSVSYMDKTSGQMQQKSIGQGLNLGSGENHYVIFRDINSQMEFIRKSRDIQENGLYVELGEYKCHAFVDFRELSDDDGRWAQVFNALNGSGYWAIQAKYDEMFTKVIIPEETQPEKPKKVRKKAAPKKTVPKAESAKTTRTRKKKNNIQPN